MEAVDLKGNRGLIDAASAAGVAHFVFTSALIAERDSPSRFMQAKALSEEHLRASALDYTILAPHAFLEIWAGATVGLPLQTGQLVTLVGEARCRTPLSPWLTWRLLRPPRWTTRPH